MKKKHVTIRAAGMNDLEAILDIENRAFRKDRFSKRQYIYLLTRANSSVYLLAAGEKAAGTAVMLWRRNSKIGRLYNIAIDPDLQGQGLGAILLDTCEENARKKNCAAVSLEVRSDNRGAIRFYRDRGYEVTATLRRYYSDGGNGVRMIKSLV